MQITVPVPMTETHATRINIDHHKHRRAYVLSCWQVEYTGDSEVIPLSSGRFFTLETTERKNPARLRQLAARIETAKHAIAGAYVAKVDDDTIRAIIGAALS